MPVPCPAISPLTSCLSGSIGDLTATGNQYARYCIDKINPVQPGTSAQGRVLAAMKNAIVAWKALTPLQRASWDPYAASVRVPARCRHDGINLTGRDWYVGQFILRQLFGGSSPASGPTVLTRPSFSPLEIRYSVGFAPPPPLTFRVFFDATDEWVSETGARLLIYQSPPVPDHLNAWYGTYRFHYALLGSASSPPTSPATINLAFGLVPPAGTRLFWKVRVIRADGRYTSRFRPAATRNPPL